MSIYLTSYTHPLVCYRPIEPEASIKLASEKPVGKLRRSVKGTGIALLRVNDVLKHGETMHVMDVHGNKVNVLTHRPSWWPDGVGVV